MSTAAMRISCAHLESCLMTLLHTVHRLLNIRTTRSAPHTPRFCIEFVTLKPNVRYHHQCENVHTFAELFAALRCSNTKSVGTSVSALDKHMTVSGGMSSGHNIKVVHEKSRQKACMPQRNSESHTAPMVWMHNQCNKFQWEQGLGK